VLAVVLDHTAWTSQNVEAKAGMPKLWRANSELAAKTFSQAKLKSMLQYQTVLPGMLRPKLGCPSFGKPTLSWFPNIQSGQARGSVLQFRLYCLEIDQDSEAEMPRFRAQIDPRVLRCISSLAPSAPSADIPAAAFFFLGHGRILT